MKINKNLEFSIKLMILIALVFFLVFDFLLQVYSPKTNMLGIPLMERLSIYYAFFTTQSNYAVVIYLIVALFMKKIYNTKPAFGIELAMTVYITLTMIVFWFGLLASPDEIGSYNKANWISTIVLHLFIPSIMIGYFLISCGDYYHSRRKYSKFALPLTCFYPFAYLIFVMLRGEVRFNNFSPEFFNYIYSNGSDDFWNNVWNSSSGVIDKTVPFTSQMWYPYWFLNVHKYSLVANGYTYESNMDTPYVLIFFTFFMAFVGITTLVVSFQFFYLNLNNDKFYKWHDINGKLITKEEHDYRNKNRKLQKIKFKNEFKMQKVHKKSEFKVFKKTIKNLSSDLKKSELKTWKRNKALENKIKRAHIKQKALSQKIAKSQIKRMIASVNYKDRAFIKENLREAERFKRLVKNGVIISKTKYVD